MQGTPRDLRIYGALIVNLMMLSSLLFAIFVLSFMLSAIVKVFRDFWDRNILSAKSPPISDRTGDLLCLLFGKFYVFPVNHLSENWITAKRSDFCCQYSPSTNFYDFYLIGHQPNHT